jgi:hypothetical protein
MWHRDLPPSTSDLEDPVTVSNVELAGIRRANRTPPAPSYEHAHWYFLAALGVIVAGFWGSFFRPAAPRDVVHSVHGVTATLWIMLLAAQSFLMSRGQVRWHRRVARGAFLLMPVMLLSAVHIVRVMIVNATIPAPIGPMLALFDLPAVAFTAICFGMGLANIRRPSAHKRFMAATVMPAFSPALARLFQTMGSPSFFFALHASLVVTHLVLVALIVSDWRRGVRERAYPLALAFFLALHAVLVPVGTSAWWGAQMARLATAPWPL